MTRLDRICLLAFLVPVCAVTTGAAWVAAGERMGLAPLARHAPANIAEAAARGLAGDVVRFLRAGQDPRRVYTVGPEAISSVILRLTGLEAALWSRQLEMIQLLDREGTIDADDRPRLACLATDLDLEDIVEYLVPEANASCEPGKAMERVLAETQRGAGQ